MTSKKPVTHGYKPQKGYQPAKPHPSDVSVPSSPGAGYQPTSEGGPAVKPPPKKP